MDKQLIFDFKTDISSIDIPAKLNNPFGTYVPDIARVAAKEFQAFINLESKNGSMIFVLKKEKCLVFLWFKKKTIRMDI